MLKTKLIIAVGDAKISSNPADTLATYSLGSCIAVCLYDPAVKIGGILHYQLPTAKLDAEKAKKNPFMFADSGINMLYKAMTSMGVTKKFLEVKIVGGSTMQMGPKGFDIGKRNYLAARKILWQQGLFVDAEDVGGSSPRNVYMNIEDGTVIVRSVGKEKAL